MPPTNQDITAIRREIDGVSKDIDNIRTDIREIRSSVSDIKDDIKELSTTVAHLTTTIEKDELLIHGMINKQDKPAGPTGWMALLITIVATGIISFSAVLLGWILGFLKVVV